MRNAVLKVMTVNVLFAAVIGSVLGPASFKMTDTFDLVGWAGKAPFYLLLLYIGPAVLVLRRRSGWARGGVLVGVLFALPLALWSIATRCAPLVTAGYLLGGAGQGLLLAWLARPSEHEAVATAAPSDSA